MAVSGEVSTTNMVVWMVRILLPIIFFFVWYRLGPGSGEDTENQHSREELLLVREVVKGCEAPECMNNIKMVADATVNPGGSARQQPTRNNPGARPKRAGRTSSDASLAKTDTAASGEFNFSDSPDGAASGDGTSPGPAVDAGLEMVAGTNGKDKKPLLSKVERMHFESLLKFVAFAHKDGQQRVFLPSEKNPPPPPPKNVAVEPAEEESLESVKANMEAESLLKAATNTKIKMKCDDVAKNLYQKLTDTGVKISETTFTMMVEACIQSGDLKGASGFLMKMESNGLCPNSELLDKVMDLYSQNRATETADESLQPKKDDMVEESSSKRRDAWSSIED